MSDAEIIEVVKAHMEGKKIEWKTTHEVPDLSWMDGAPMPWDFGRYQYRVAPEPRKPREWYARVFKDGSGSMNLDDEYLDGVYTKSGCEKIRVREILE